MIRSGHNDPSKYKCWKLFRATLNACALIARAFRSLLKEKKFALERAGCFPMLAGLCCERSSAKIISTQKDRKFILFIGHSRHGSSSLSSLCQVSEGTPVTPNIAFIIRFSTPTSCRSHAGTPQNFKTHAEDLRRNLN